MTGAVPESAPVANPTPAPAWRRAFIFGAMGGVTLTAMEILLLPPGLSTEELLEIVVHVLPQWIVTGVCLTFIAMSAIDRLRVGALALVLVAFAITMSAAFAGIRHLFRMLALPTGGSIFAGNAPPLPTFLYDLWVILFFGSLFLAACTLNFRAERTRNLLVRAEIGRSRTATQLDAAHLSALQGHVDPAFLLRVMTEVERRFGHDSAAADRLLDRLVMFLRRAMPGVRSGQSTLSAEIDLVTDYANLWRELDPLHTYWQVRSDGPIPKLPFPPLLLLPVVDHWAAALVAGAHGELCVRCNGNAAALTLDGPMDATGPWLPEPLAYRLHVGLRTACGDAWQLALNDPALPHTFALSLTLPGASPAAANHPKETALERN